jgi:hypothetical protein
MLSEIERGLLLRYTEGKRIVRRRARSQQHLRLLAFGYIKEQVIDFGRLLISVTGAGYAALNEGPSAAKVTPAGDVRPTRACCRDPSAGLVGAWGCSEAPMSPDVKCLPKWSNATCPFPLNCPVCFERQQDAECD